jgi:hypothetical protein
MMGTNAALQLLPVPTFMIDANGVLLGSNEAFEDLLGISGALLNGREWWQGFATRSSVAGIAMHSRSVRSDKLRGDDFVELVRNDNSTVRLTLRWLRVTEPSSHRPLWIYAITDDGLSPNSRQITAASNTTGEMAAVAAQDLRAALSGNQAELGEQVRTVIEKLERVVEHESPGMNATVSTLLRLALGAKLADRAQPIKVSGDVSCAVRTERGDPARAIALFVQAATNAMNTIVPLFIEASKLEQDVALLIRPIRRPSIAPSTVTEHPVQVAEAIITACGGYVEWRRAESSLLICLPRE